MNGSSEVPPSTLARRQKEHLRLAPHVYSYVGTVQIGTPLQSFTIVSLLFVVVASVMGANDVGYAEHRHCEFPLHGASGLI
jgi:hypothetical protein